MARKGRIWRQRSVREALAPRNSAKATPPGITGVLYDTDVLIEILRGRRSVVRAAINLEATGVPTYVSPISCAEISAGMHAGDEPIIQSFVGARSEVVFDSHTGRLAGSYLARYAKSHEIEIADALIAAAASAAGLILWTLNRKHYPMPDIRFYET